MPRIESISRLRDKSREISQFCHQQDEPVFLTTNGRGDLVVMSVEHYERLQARLDLYAKLGTAQASQAAGDKGVLLSKAMQSLRKRIRNHET